MLDLDLRHVPSPPLRTDYRIGVIGAGFIVRDVQLVAYRNAGFDVRAIASDNPDQASEVAEARGVPKAYDDWRELLADPEIEVVDIAVPPSVQQEVVREAVGYAGRIRGILAQKPLAMDYAEALATVRLCEEAGVTLAVNQNMRYDQSMRADRKSVV